MVNFLGILGSKVSLYGLYYLQSFTDTSYVVLTLGEENTQILWHYHIQALGLSYNINFKPEFSKYFDKFDKIYICTNDTLESTKFVRQISEVLPCDKLYKIVVKPDVLSLHINGNFDFNNLLASAVAIASAENNKEVKTEKEYVVLGKKLIESLHIKIYNDKLYIYVNGVYKIADNRLLQNYILKNIDINTEEIVQKKAISFISSWLANTNVHIETNYVNFTNGLYDIDKQCFIPHTTDLFTINQVHVDYLEELSENQVVENFLDDLTCHDVNRKKALKQVIGYILTPSLVMQQGIVFYGPKASNGKSTLCKILTNIVGSENTCHVELQQFEKRFGANEIDQKLLNVVSELPSTKINDVGVYKGAVTGDEFMADVKNEDRKRITPYCKHIFSTNVLPQVADTTDGFYRRLNIILFDNKFEVSNNFDISVFLEQENLNYLANIGFREFLNLINSSEKLQFANYEESNQILQAYKLTNDTVLSFLKDTEFVPESLYGRDLRTTQIWYWYKSFCLQNDLKPLKKVEFYSQLQNKYNFFKKTINGYEYFFRTTPI